MRKTLLTFIIVTSLAGTANALQPFVPFSLCDPRGIWVGSAPPFFPELGDQGLIISETASSLDLFSRRLSAVLHPFNPEFTFGGLFPEATAGSPDAYGVYSRVGRDLFEITFRSYFVKAPPAGLPIRGQVQYWIVIRGTAECLDRETKQLNTVFSVYSNMDDPDLIVPALGINGIHDQDRDDDGFEDPGEVPIVSGVLPLILKRVNVEPAPALMVP